jgi:hypothetical protein
MGDLAIRYRVWEVAAGGFWAPEKSLEGAGGTVHVRSIGGTGRGCFAFFDDESRLRASGCALFVVASLRGAGEGYDPNTDEIHHRPWFLAGAGADVHLRLTSRISLGSSVAVLGTLRNETFYVLERGTRTTPYATDRLVGWVGADFRVRIW